MRRAFTDSCKDKKKRAIHRPLHGLAFALIFCVILDSQADSIYRKTRDGRSFCVRCNFGLSEHAHEHDETP